MKGRKWSDINAQKPPSKHLPSCDLYWTRVRCNSGSPPRVLGRLIALDAGKGAEDFMAEPDRGQGQHSHDPFDIAHNVYYDKYR